MQDSKNPLTSVTIWGGLVALGAAAFGWETSAEDAQMIAENLESILAAVAGLLAILGRFRASTTLKF